MNQAAIEKVIFLNFDGTEGSVFWSQIVAPMRALQRRRPDLDVSLVTLNRIDAFLSSGRRRRAQEALSKSGLSALLLPRFPVFLNAFLWMNLLFLYPAFLRWRGRRSVVHARGPYSALLADRLRRLPGLDIARVVYDCRGDIVAEHLDYARGGTLLSRFKVWQLRRLEGRVLSRVDHVNAVSQALMNVLRERYSYRGEFTITPSCIDAGEIGDSLSAHPDRREELGLLNRFVLVYSGSMLPWQMPKELVMIFNLFRSIEPGSFFLILTSDPNGILPYLHEGKISEENYRIIPAGPKELFSYIACGDLGLLLREENATNRVASPTKFAEYVGSGVPVLLTRGIGDLDGVAREIQGGWVLDSMDVNDVLKQKIAEILRRGRPLPDRKSELRASAARLFSIDSHVERLLASYGASRGVKS